MLDEPSWLAMAARAFDFIAQDDDARRSARPFVAPRPAQISGARVGFRRHDPRRARALRGDRRAALPRPGAGLATRARSRLRRCRDRHATISPPPTPKGLVIRPASTADEATPNHNAVAAQNLIRLARARRRRSLARASRPADRGDRAAGRREPLHAHGAAQCRRPAAARRRDRGHRGGRAARGPACGRARSAAARPHRAARPIGGGAAAGTRRAPRSTRRPNPRLSSASAKPARCRSPIRPVSLAPSMRCDILDGTAPFADDSCFMDHAGAKQGDVTMRYGNTRRAALAAPFVMCATGAQAEEWCGYASRDKAVIECGYSTAPNARTPSARAACVSSTRIRAQDEAAFGGNPS